MPRWTAYPLIVLVGVMADLLTIILDIIENAH